MTQKSPPERRVYEALYGGASTIAEVMETTGLSIEEIEDAVGELLKLKLIKVLNVEDLRYKAITV